MSQKHSMFIAELIKNKNIKQFIANLKIKNNKKLAYHIQKKKKYNKKI